MRVYEELFIVKPDAPEEEVKAFIEQVKQVIANGKGNIEKVDDWGTRKLAYRVSKQREGYFVYMSLRSTQGELIKELERRLKVTDAVIKYMTIRLDEEIKRQQKLAARREQRTRRRPRRAGGTPSAGPAPSPSPSPSQGEPAAAAG